MEQKMCGYANEGDGIQPLPADEKEIKKLKSGIYADKKLRLIVDPAGNRKWVFRFIWRSYCHGFDAWRLGSVARNGPQARN